MLNYDYDVIRKDDDTFVYRLWHLIKSAVTFFVGFVLAIIAIEEYSFIGKNIIIYALILCMLASMLNYALSKNDRKNTCIRVKRNLLIYAGGLVAAHFVLEKLMNIDINQTGVSLGLSTGGVTQNAAAGWLQMMVQFWIIGTPISHVGYEIKSIFTYYDPSFGKVSPRKRMEQLQKTIIKSSKRTKNG